jgi:hypothetical protein
MQPILSTLVPLFDFSLWSLPFFEILDFGKHRLHGLTIYEQDCKVH